MRVFVAGATGTGGTQVVRELLGRGHAVVGMSRSHTRASAIERLGAEAVVADALDRESVERVLGAARPDGVVSVLTSLPRTGPRRAKDLEPTNRLRDEGTRNVVDAAIAAGARRFVGESIIAVYGFGPRSSPAPEDESPAHETDASLQRAVDAAAAGEGHLRAASQAGQIEGASLRFGFYHGAGAPSTEFMLRLVSRRMLPAIGGGRALHSWIELGDAARAVADCLEHAEPAPSITSSTTSGRVPQLSRRDGPPRRHEAPAQPPLRRRAARDALRRALPLAGQIPASNARLKRELGWRPQLPTYREALALAAGGT